MLIHLHERFGTNDSVDEIRANRQNNQTYREAPIRKRIIALFEILNNLRVAAYSRQRIPIRYYSKAGTDARSMLNKILHNLKVVMNGGKF